MQKGRTNAGQLLTASEKLTTRQKSSTMTHFLKPRTVNNVNVNINVNIAINVSESVQSLKPLCDEFRRQLNTELLQLSVPPSDDISVHRFQSHKRLDSTHKLEQKTLSSYTEEMQILLSDSAKLWQKQKALQQV